MNTTIAIKEKRSTINKFREWYKTNIYDTGKSQKAFDMFDNLNKKNHDFTKIKNKIGKTVCYFIPECRVLGPQLAKVSDKLADLQFEFQKKYISDGGKKLEAKILGDDGIYDASMPNLNMETLYEDIEKTTKVANELNDIVNNIIQDDNFDKGKRL